MEIVVIFVVAIVRFALDPIGWLAVAAGVVVSVQWRARWWIVFLAAAVLAGANVLLVNPARRDLGLGPIPPARMVVIFAALSVLGFAGYWISDLIGKLRAARKPLPPP